MEQVFSMERKRTANRGARATGYIGISSKVRVITHGFSRMCAMLAPIVFQLGVRLVRLPPFIS